MTKPIRKWRGPESNFSWFVSSGESPSAAVLGFVERSSPRAPTSGTPGQAQPVQNRIPAAYTIETGDIRKAFEALKSRGVEFETGVLEYPWGYIAVFQDPDGSRLQLREGR